MNNYDLLVHRAAVFQRPFPHEGYFSSTYADYLPGDKIVKAFPRGDRISLKILKACGKEYPIEADKALRRNGECFPFNISDIETC